MSDTSFLGAYLRMYFSSMTALLPKATICVQWYIILLLTLLDSKTILVVYYISHYLYNKYLTVRAVAGDENLKFSICLWKITPNVSILVATYNFLFLAHKMQWHNPAHGIPTEPPRGVGWVALTGGVQCILRDCTPVETRQLKAKGFPLTSPGY